MSEDNWKEPGRGSESMASTPRPQPAKPASGKEWKLIEKLILTLTSEQKKARRWGIFFKLLTFGYLFALLFLFNSRVDDGMSRGAEHTALVEVKGVIADGEDASADAIVTGLRKAFEDERTKGVVLRINSPGGSPVQSGYVYDEIKRLREKHPDTALYAVISDLGASGAYYIAAAADEIYADKASLVGSIGVTASGFGFVDVLEKIGVERRIYTSGEHKTFLDPFSPEQKDEVEFWKKVLQTTHEQFIDQVRKGRGDRLKETADMFSGLIWSGEQALEMGLIDGLGSSSYVAREKIGAEKIVDFTPKPDPLERFTKSLGASFASALAKLTVEGGAYQIR